MDCLLGRTYIVVLYVSAVGSPERVLEQSAAKPSYSTARTHKALILRSRWVVEKIYRLT